MVLSGPLFFSFCLLLSLFCCVFFSYLCRCLVSFSFFFILDARALLLYHLMYPCFFTLRSIPFLSHFSSLPCPQGTLLVIQSLLFVLSLYSVSFSWLPLFPFCCCRWPHVLPAALVLVHSSFYSSHFIPIVSTARSYYCFTLNLHIKMLHIK